jgi:hypothetical protein
MSVTPSRGAGKGGNCRIVVDSSVSADSLVIVVVVSCGEGRWGRKVAGVEGYLEFGTHCGAQRIASFFAKKERRPIRPVRCEISVLWCST